jgi:cellulose synthase/poly-beta-1,6-N-acetylglucosamine synthase-like glycosyltransferase
MVLFSAYHIWDRKQEKQKADTGAQLPMISIIIPARNEAENIDDCLHAVLAQSYPDFEVILINDHSTDQTRQQANSIAQKDKRLRVFDLETDNTIAYKKAAITQGISLAQGDIIMQTDADCTVGRHWLKAISERFMEGHDFVSAPVLLTGKKKLFDSLQILEYQGLVMLGAGSLLGGFPHMANGANMAYRRSAFAQVGGFAGVDHVASGDDELLLQKIHRAGLRLDFLLDRRAIVKTHVMKTLSGFKAQRLRWVSKARAYQNRWINAVQLISFGAFAAFPLWGLMGKWDFFLAGFLGKMLIDAVLMIQAARFFRTFRLLWLLPLLELVYIPYVLWVGIAGNFVKQYSWKDRTVS